MRAFLEQDSCGHDRSLDPAGPTQHGLTFHEAVRDALVLAKGRQGHHHLEGVAVGCHDETFNFVFGDGFEALVDSLLDLSLGEQLL